MSEFESVLPLLPLRDLVVFPHMVVPLIVGRKRSRDALLKAYEGDKTIFLAAQREAMVTEPRPKDIFEVGTVATIIQMLRLPDDNLKVLVEGQHRARIIEHVEGEDYPQVSLEGYGQALETDLEVEALMRTVRTGFEQYVKLNRGVPPELLLSVASIDDASQLADTLVAHLSFKFEDRQALLEESDPRERLERLHQFIHGEIEILQVERKIKSRVKKQMEKTQKEYYLNEQMSAIQKELGDQDEFKNEIDELLFRASKKELSDEAREKVDRELRKLKMMSPMSAEANVVRTYLDWVLSLPWEVTSEDSLDIDHATTVLDEDHHGLEEVKERVLENLAVSSLVQKVQGPILCLVGPPGVGKTSLGRSIARATGRKFVRQSLGGVRDEAEIRGHRRTYIGAMPGKIVQSLRKAGTSNPVFLLDEIDKMSTDFRGDPSAALLEVLDPEQNNSFNDHYLELDCDLSKIMFICTANSLAGIPGPLRDRLEVISLSGYTETEKMAIARQYLIPKQMEAHGLTGEEIEIEGGGIDRLLQQYTREAGVRNLEREIGKVCRKVATEVVRTRKEGAPSLATVSAENLPDFLGVPRFIRSPLEDVDGVGIVKGLAVTPWGGEMLDIEVVIVPGSGKLIRTGNLGDNLKESAMAALTYVRSRAESLGLERDFYESWDVHVHYPGNPMKTDGPSAGIAMATALASALTGVPVANDIAMTGEITLGGRALPIGGLKEKILAAHRGGITRVLIPEANEKDIEKVPEGVREKVEIIPVHHMDQVLELALRPMDGRVFKPRPVDPPTVKEGSEADPGSGPPAPH
jgi:ATP-dependent Lon protease